MDISKENWRFYVYMRVKLSNNATQIHADLVVYTLERKIIPSSNFSFQSAIFVHKPNLVGQCPLIRYHFVIIS